MTGFFWSTEEKENKHQPNFVKCWEKLHNQGTRSHSLIDITLFHCDTPPLCSSPEMTFDAKELSVKYMAQLSTTPVQCSTLSCSLLQLHKYWEQIVVRINVIIFSNVMQQSMVAFHTVTIQISVHKWTNAPAIRSITLQREAEAVSSHPMMPKIPPSPTSAASETYLVVSLSLLWHVRSLSIV